MSNQVDELVSKYFGFSSSEVSAENLEELKNNKMFEYSELDEVERARRYASDMLESLENKTHIVDLTSSLANTINLIKMHKAIPEVFKRETLRFFNSQFADFDKNSAVSFGHQLRKSLSELREEIKNSRPNDSEKLKEVLLNRLIFDSKNKFFISLRSDIKKKVIFEKRLKYYCDTIWVIEFQKQGNIFRGDSLAERIANERQSARNQIEEFLDDKCRVNVNSVVKTTHVYKAYENWIEEKGGSMVGKRIFLDELYKQIPFVVQTIIDGNQVIKGIKIAS